MGFPTEFSEVNFKKVKIGVNVRIPKEGEDYTKDASKSIQSIILYKTFPFSFVLNGETIYGDFWIRQDTENSAGKKPFQHAVALFNLTPSFVSMDFLLTNETNRNKTYGMKTELAKPSVYNKDVIKSQIIKDNLPNNKSSAAVWSNRSHFLDEPVINSDWSLKCKIEIFLPPVNNANIKSFLCDEAIAQFEEDKNFTLICDGQRFHFNKTLLSLISPVFGRMVQASNSKEALTNSVVIEDFTPETIQAFQRVSFSNEEIKDDDLTPELLMFAQKYLMKTLVTKIKVKLIDSLNNDNIFDVLKAAYLIDDQDMFKEASAYLLKHIKQLKGTPGWNTFKIEHHDCMIEALTI